MRVDLTFPFGFQYAPTLALNRPSNVRIIPAVKNVEFRVAGLIP